MSDFTNPEAGYIYVVRFGSLYKIGMSIVPRQRVYQVSPRDHGRELSGHPDLRAKRIVMLIKQVPNMRRAERFLHMHFESQRVTRESSEWFHLDPSDVEWIRQCDTLDYADPVHPIPEGAEIDRILGSGAPVVIWQAGRVIHHFWDAETRRTFCGRRPGPNRQFLSSLIHAPVCAWCLKTAHRHV